MFDYKSALLSLVFITNLSVGSTGTDVVALQEFLVAKNYLKMPDGVSMGYFGPLTKRAVSTWQVDTGISPAVGYFGPISRAAIARQTTLPAITTNPSPTLPPPPSVLPSVVETDTPVELGLRSNRLMLFSVFPFEVRPGDVIVLDGSGFSKTINQVYFNGSNSITATSTNGTNLELMVPSSLSEGEYKLSVSNVLGSSDNPDIKILLRVTNNPKSAPTIESASIVSDTVTLIGNGFTSANNLFTTLGDSSSPVSSSGTSLTFRIIDLSRYNQIREFTKGKYQASLWIYVQNEHGINKDPYELKIII